MMFFDLWWKAIDDENAKRLLEASGDYRYYIENMRMFYDEVKDRLPALGILSLSEIEEQQRLLLALQPESLPAAWGIFSVVCEA